MLTNLKYLNFINERRNKFDDIFIFGTNFNVNGIIIPGRIKIFDFQIKLIRIISNEKFILNSKKCSLKGKIETGLVVLNGKKINNIRSVITKEQNSCSMEVEWLGRTTIEIQFSFTFKFELDLIVEENYEKPFRKEFHDLINNFSTEIWLSCKEN